MRTTPISLPQLYWRMRGILFYALAVSAFLILAPLAIIYSLTGRSAARLDTDRVETVATITQVDNYMGADTLSQRSGQTVLTTDMTFTFTTDDGQVIEGERHIPGAKQESQLGETFAVWYSASDPQLYELAIGHHRRNADALRGIFGFWGFLIGVPLAALAVYIPLKRARQALRIRDRGGKENATVREPTKQDVQHGRGEHLHWQVKGQQPGYTYFPVAEADRPLVGETITVYQLDQKSVWEKEFGPQAGK